MNPPESSEERIEWCVSTNQTNDFFEDDEQGARDWLARTESDPEWAPAVLLRRVIVTDTYAWEEV